MKGKLVPYHKYKTIDNFAIDMTNWHNNNPHPISHFLFLLNGLLLILVGLVNAGSGGLFFCMLGMCFAFTGFMGFKEDEGKTGDFSNMKRDFVCLCRRIPTSPDKVKRIWNNIFSRNVKYSPQELHRQKLIYKQNNNPKRLIRELKGIQTKYSKEIKNEYAAANFQNEETIKRYQKHSRFKTFPQKTNCSFFNTPNYISR